MSAGGLPGRHLAGAVLVTIALTGIWSSLVQGQVPDPYLDEVFHVRQAQVYCLGDFRTWDSKITTPPGLYLVSYVLFRLTGRCDIDFLRLTNAGTLCLIVIESYYLLLRFTQANETIPVRAKDNVQLDITQFQQKLESRKGWQAAHTALNIALFPPIFFFSALYYTDLESLLAVLIVCHLCMIQLLSVRSGRKLECLQVVLGVIALLFRQTNVFWVGLYPIGFIAHHVNHSTAPWTQSFISPEPWLEDFFRVGSSIVVVGLKRLFTLIRLALPYCAIIGTFIAFVIWNGGVVLGDKSNHVATLHFPQLLYIWPCFLFFSFPVTAVPLGLRFLQAQKRRGLWSQLPRIWIFAMVSFIALLVVKYNTIIHPFTLADNRHYVFYVFKVLRRHWALKYLAVPAYILSAWIAQQSVTTANNTQKDSYPRKRTPDTQICLIYYQGSRRIGHLLVWLATTTLCLITAPLVEPRYYIVPWVIWRLSIHPDQQKPVYLWLETAWYCIVNVLTCYMFLFRPFEWMQEPGRKQRFMW